MFEIKLEKGRTIKVAKDMFWHTSSHILAHAVKRLFPEVKLRNWSCDRARFLL